MTIEQAIAIANQTKPTHRASLDKLQCGDALGQHVAGVTALSKRFGELGADVLGMQKRLDQIRADLDHVENNPGAKRVIH